MISWEEIKTQVAEIIGKEAAADDRAQCWVDAIKSGKLGNIEGCMTYDPDYWSQQMRDVKDSVDAREFSQSDPYRFFAAAEYHRSYVLKRLLPKFGLLMA